VAYAEVQRPCAGVLNYSTTRKLWVAATNATIVVVYRGESSDSYLRCFVVSSVFAAQRRFVGDFLEGAAIIMSPETADRQKL
jgi:hypothetical protein